MVTGTVNRFPGLSGSESSAPSVTGLVYSSGAPSTYVAATANQVAAALNGANPTLAGATFTGTATAPTYNVNTATNPAYTYGSTLALTRTATATLAVGTTTGGTDGTVLATTFSSATAVTVAAGGTNQNVNIRPSGTGMVIEGVASASNPLTYFHNIRAPFGSLGIDLRDSTYDGTRSTWYVDSAQNVFFTGYYDISTSSSYGSLNFLAPGNFNFKNGSTSKLTLYASGGMFLGFSPSDPGAGTFSTTYLSVSSNIYVGSTAGLVWLTKGVLTQPSDGTYRFSNSAGTGFGLLQFGGGTSSYPAIKRNSAALAVRLADDSGDANLSVASLIATAPIKPGSYTVGTVPSASTYTGYAIYVSDGGGGRHLAVSDGTNWLWSDGTTVGTSNPPLVVGSNGSSISRIRFGVATLTSGTVTVNDTTVTANTKIFPSAQDNNTVGTLRVSARVAGTSFTISSSASDNGVVGYLMIEP